MTKATRPKSEREDGSADDAAPVVALVSGGADSCVMLARSLARRQVFPLYVRQGALWEDAEEPALRRFLKAVAPGGGRLAPLRVTHLDLPDGYASRWAVQPDVTPPDLSSPDDAVYLPGRNLALLMEGALLAQSLGVRIVEIGLLAGNPFPDSRPEFFNSFQNTFNLATGCDIQVEAPLQKFTKAQVLRLGMGLPMELTFSCLRPVEGRHCGGCNKCAERRRGFAEAGLEDPTVYFCPAL